MEVLRMKPYKTALPFLLAALTLASPALAADDAIAESANTAPVAENQSIETYRGVSVGGQLSAYDAEGDEVIFELTTEPMKGSVELTADGCFVYTPGEKKRGKDYFGFRAVDSEGNTSQEGTVIIKLVKQSSKLTYADLGGSGTEYAAVMLTEKGVFTAETIGGDYVFSPAETVSRGEFLSMCMNAADCELIQGVSSTGFADDDEIGAWLKPYVATALYRGYIGEELGGSFRSDEPIDLRDACVMLNSVLGITDVVSAAAYIDLPEPEGSQAVANLTACDVMLNRWSDLDARLTRAEAAELLGNAMTLLKNR